MAKKQNKNIGDELFQYSIQNAMNEIVQKHPKFAGSEKYLIKSLNQNDLRNKYYELKQRVEEKNNLNPQAKAEYVANKLSSYITEGHAFNDAGKEVILRKGLEEKASEGESKEKRSKLANWFYKKFNKPDSDLNNDKYINNAIEAFDNLTNLMKTGDYGERMPEVTESLTTLYDLKFLDPATDILKEYGLIDEKKHAFLKKSIYKKAEESSKAAVSGIEKYVSTERIAASVIAFVGILLVLFNLRITGAIIGGDNKVTLGIAGVFMLLFALLLYFRPLKRTFKK